MQLIASDSLPAIQASQLEAEAGDLAEEALKAERARQARLEYRRSEMRGWGLLAASICTVAACLWMFPATVTRIAPGAAGIYKMFGIRVNPQGFDVRQISTHQTLTTSGQVVLAVRGEVRNTSRWARKAPGLLFVLRDASGRKLREWKLPAIATRAVEPGKQARFLTRLAAPPKEARRVEVRFLRKS